MSSCVFCKIIAGDIPCPKVYEDAQNLAFLDINPVSRGHTLVIPKHHYELISQMPEKDYLSYMKTLQNVAKGLLRYTEGINVLQNNGKDAGQLVPHVHFHIIPRRPGDEVHIGDWKASHDPDIEKVQKVIQSLLND